MPVALAFALALAFGEMEPRSMRAWMRMRTTAAVGLGILAVLGTGARTTALLGLGSSALLGTWAPMGVGTFCLLPIFVPIVPLTSRLLGAGMLSGAPMGLALFA